MYKYASGPDCYCELLSPEEVQAQWDALVPHLKESVRYFYGYVDLDFYKNSLISDPDSVYKLWVVYVKEEFHAVFLTKLENIGVKKVFTYEIIGGHDFNYWAQTLCEEFEQRLTRELHIDQFRVVGRHGWIKKMKANGYNFAYAICIRETKV